VIHLYRVDIDYPIQYATFQRKARAVRMTAIYTGDYAVWSVDVQVMQVERRIGKPSRPVQRFERPAANGIAPGINPAAVGFFDFFHAPATASSNRRSAICLFLCCVRSVSQSIVIVRPRSLPPGCSLGVAENWQCSEFRFIALSVQPAAAALPGRFLLPTYGAAVRHSGDYAVIFFVIGHSRIPHS